MALAAGIDFELYKATLGASSAAGAAFSCATRALIPVVVLGGGPGDKLVGFGAQRERGFGKRRPENAQGVVQRAGGRRAFELVDGDGGTAAGIALDVDLLQDLS